MKTLFRRALIALVALVALLAAGDVATYDPAAWTADLDRIEADMAQGYANLDWIASVRKLDLPRLDRTTRARLVDAHSRLRAFLAVRDFVHAFRDPHLRLRWGDRPIEELAPAAGVASDVGAARVAGSYTGAEADCAKANYEEDDHSFVFPVDRLAGWRSLGNGDFPFGVAGDVGVLRIAAFGEDKYAGACAKVARAGLDERALQLAVREHQQAQLRTALATLRGAGAKRLLIDVTGNGGGSEWVSEVIALMTPRRMSRAEVRVVGPTCDRRGVWQGKPACSVFAPAQARATLDGSGEWSGPVLVLADRNTASAAEDLVAWLQQNKVARVIGERTMGAGCGYMDGGTRTQLRASHFDLMMPNCARYLDDGTNEIEGIAPDVAIDMHLEDPAAQADALSIALARK
jgi:hypothetical protein